MKAVQQDKFGGPGVLYLADIPAPVPLAGQALIRVSAAAINPADWKLRSGEIRRIGKPPFTLGLDVSGVVTAVGPGASNVTVGDHVYGCALPPRGSHAEFALAPVASLTPKPDSIDHLQAAAYPVAALTALQAVREAHIESGQRVLIHAAAGAVGQLAIQIAKVHGAHVTGTARRIHWNRLRDLGADELVDYTTDDFTQAVDRVDVVIDPVSGEYGQRSAQVIRPGGRLIDIRGAGPERSAIRAATARFEVVYVELNFVPSDVDLAAVSHLIERHHLHAAVGHVAQLDHAVKAHLIAENHQADGKVIFAVDQDAAP